MTTVVAAAAVMPGERDAVATGGLFSDTPFAYNINAAVWNLPLFLLSSIAADFDPRPYPPPRYFSLPSPSKAPASSLGGFEFFKTLILPPRMHARTRS